MNLTGTKNNGFTPENRGSNYWQLKFFRLLVGLFFVFSAPNVSGAISPRVSKTIDSIENLNIYAHDTVKIRNYILLYDKLKESNPDTVLYFLDKALKIAMDEEFKEFKAQLLFFKADIYDNKGDYTRALELYKRSLEIAQIKLDESLIINLYNRIGIVYTSLNIFDDAFNFFIEALKICDKDQNPIMYSKVINNIGFVHQAQKKYKRALDYFKQSLKINEYIKREDGIASCYNNIGVVYLSLGEYDSVQYYFNKALKIYEGLNDKKSQSVPLYNIGEAYFAIRKYDNAIHYVLQSYEIDKFYNDLANMAKDLHMLGKIYSKKGFYKYGLELFYQALDLSTEINDVIEKKDIYLNIAENYEKLNVYLKALEYYKLHSEYKDTIYNIESSKLIFELETKYQTEQQRKENELQKVMIDNQQTEIRQQFTQKMAFLSGLVLFFIFSSVIYRNYKNKKKSNLLLQRQNEQIETMSAKIHDIDKQKMNFFTGISHELRTPLTVIIGLTDQLIKQGAPDGILKSINGVKRNSVKLGNLVDQMLDLRKLDEGQMKLKLAHGSIVSFLSAILSPFECLAAEKEIKLEFKKPPEDITGYFDADKLEKIMTNLVSNAIKFSKRGDKVLAGVMVTNEKKSHIKIEVADTGIGIPPGQLEYVFKPFFQASDNMQGSGIGLALAKELTERLNGDISVDSVTGKGTRFTLVLPILKDYFENCEAFDEQVYQSRSSMDNYLSLLMHEIKTVENTGNNNTEISEAEISEKSLLIVEDNADLREFVAGIFTVEYRVYTAGNGEEGLQVAKARMPDIIISDVMMPQMDGIEMCDHLKNDERTSHIPVILLTAKAADEHYVEGYDTGADDYITKPFSRDILVSRVKNILVTREKLRKKFSKTLLGTPADETFYEMPDRQFINKINELINENIENPGFDVDQFVEKVNMSRAQLYRKVKALSNLSVKEYIRVTRLKKAIELIIKNNLNISEISYQVGFSSPSYFAKCFKEQFGVSPKEYAEKKTSGVNG